MRVVYAVLAAGIAIMIYALFEAEDRYRASCEVLGGRVVNDMRAGFGISSTGTPVTTFVPSEFCVSADGRILFPE